MSARILLGVSCGLEKNFRVIGICTNRPQEGLLLPDFDTEAVGRNGDYTERCIRQIADFLHIWLEEG
jgi:hypothetical protein